MHLAGNCAWAVFPGLVQAVGALEVAQANLTVGLLICVMVIPMLVKVDFGALGEVRQHVRGIGVNLFVNWLVKPFKWRFWAGSSSAIGLHRFCPQTSTTAESLA